MSNQLKFSRRGGEADEKFSPDLRRGAPGSHFVAPLLPVIKGLVINYGEGGGGELQNGKIVGAKLFAPPPPSRQGETFRAPFLKSGNFSRPPPPPPTIWLKLQDTV